MKHEQIIKKAFETYPINNVRNSLGYMYDENSDKREGYIQALTEMESMVKLHGWIVRDKDQDSYRKGKVWFSREKPKRYDDTVWMREHNDCVMIQEDVFISENFPNITWASDPVHVEILINAI